MHSRFSKERERAERHGQDHTFRFWHNLTDDEKLILLENSEKIDYGLISEMYEECIKEKKPEKFSKLEQPYFVNKYPHTDQTELAKKEGEEAIKRNELAVFLVAGGQGSRLGYSGPKGCFPGTPIIKKPLFQVLAERIKAPEKKYKLKFDWFIMTSEENRAPTEKFFEEHKYFNLEKDQIHFFTQESLPAISEHGKIMMKSKHEIFFSPNGTGGIYNALKNSGMLDLMKDKEIKYLSYINVDNPLPQIIDPISLGHHILSDSKITPKVIPKRHAHEAVGLVVKADGKQRIIEYVVLSKEDAEMLDETGNIMFRHGNTATFIMSVDYIEQVTKEKLVKFIGGKKKVAHIDEEGNFITPEKPNAYKFESYSFDPMPHVRSIAVEVRREEEFAPIKNATGEDSPEISYKMQNDLHKEWLLCAGIKPEIISKLKLVEISPLFALDKEEFKDKIKNKVEEYNKLLENKEEYYFE
ncbi:MAG: UTP--glucose-1-phosphate uridylyltransferase [Candidatus Nanoarchaeia archaeon]